MSAREGQNAPLEFKILDYKATGFNSFAWFHGETKLGTVDELESILTRFGGEGWDVVQFTGIGGNRVVLRRIAR